jgi:hypothetical protein
LVIRVPSWALYWWLEEAVSVDVETVAAPTKLSRVSIAEHMATTIGSSLTIKRVSAIAFR